MPRARSGPRFPRSESATPLGRPQRRRVHTVPGADVDHVVLDRLHGDVQSGRFLAPQTPAVDHLQHGRVAVGGQRPFPPGLDRLLHLAVGIVEQPLQLVTRQRAPPRPALVVNQVRGGVPLVAHLHRMRPEPGQTLGRPLVVGRRPSCPATFARHAAAGPKPSNIASNAPSSGNSRSVNRRRARWTRPTPRCRPGCELRVWPGCWPRGS
jgi:hypothetical protein